MPDAHLKAILRAEVAARAQGCCEHCRAQEKFSPDSFAVEHITPLSGGGSSETDNLAYSCQGCNNRTQPQLVAVARHAKPIPEPRYRPVIYQLAA